MKNKLQIWIFLLMLLCIPLFASALTLPKGIAGWFYGKDNAWVKQIQIYNSHIKYPYKFVYIFPNAGEIQVNDEDQSLTIKYDPSVARFYKKSLNKTIKILPIIKGWVGNSQFNDWSQANYARAAEKIAAPIIADKNAAGLELNLEHFSPQQLPFYRDLVQLLQSHNKILAIFVRKQDISPNLFKAVGANSIVILSGYDLYEQGDPPNYPIPPDVYATRLKEDVSYVANLAQIYKGHFMVGIPAIATTREWTEKRICTADKECHSCYNRYPQSAYLVEALKVVDKIKTSNYLGYSIWAFVRSSKGQIYLPVTISNKAWQLLLEK